MVLAEVELVLHAPHFQLAPVRPCVQPWHEVQCEAAAGCRGHPAFADLSLKSDARP